MVNFPGSLDSLANPTGTTNRDDAGFLHSVQHSNANDILEALEAKVGTGASVPAANTLHRGTGAGTSDYGQLRAGDIPAGLLMVKIAESTLGSPAATVSFDNIPQTYRHLLIEIATRNGTAAGNVLMRFSTDGTTYDAGANYDWEQVGANGATVTASEGLAQTSILTGGHSAAADVMSPSVINILDYANASYQKSALLQYGRKDGTGTGNLFRVNVAGFWRNTVAIKGVQILASANNFAAGSRFTLYGLPA